MPKFNRERLYSIMMNWRESGLLMTRDDLHGIGNALDPPKEYTSLSMSHRDMFDRICDVAESSEALHSKFIGTLIGEAERRGREARDDALRSSLERTASILRSEFPVGAPELEAPNSSRGLGGVVGRLGALSEVLRGGAKATEAPKEALRVQGVQAATAVVREYVQRAFAEACWREAIRVEFDQEGAQWLVVFEASPYLDSPYFIYEARVDPKSGDILRFEKKEGASQPAAEAPKGPQRTG